MKHAAWSPGNNKGNTEMMKQSLFAAVVAVLALSISATVARAELTRIPADADQCVVMVEEAIKEMNSMTVSDPAVVDAFDKTIGQAIQLCDKKDFAGAFDKVADAKSNLPD